MDICNEPIKKMNVYWDNEKTQLHSSYSYIISSGLKDGLHRYWYPNGLIWEESNYSNGLLVDKHIRWFDNGKKLSEMEYKVGKRHGIYREWYKNGYIKTEYYNKNDKKEGIYRYWDVNGRLRVECRYYNNKLNGVYYFYSKKKNKMIETVYLNDIGYTENARIWLFKTVYDRIWKEICQEMMENVWFRNGSHLIFYLHHI